VANQVNFGGQVVKTFKGRRHDTTANDSGLCLARKKLNQIYGRVRQRFNKQMRADNTVHDQQHLGLSSPINVQDEMEDRGNASVPLFQHSNFNAMSMQMEPPSRHRSGKQTSSIQRRNYDSDKLKELQQVYQQKGSRVRGSTNRDSSMRTRQPNDHEKSISIHDEDYVTQQLK